LEQKPNHYLGEENEPLMLVGPNYLDLSCKQADEAAHHGDLVRDAAQLGHPELVLWILGVEQHLLEVQHSPCCAQVLEEAQRNNTLQPLILQKSGANHDQNGRGKSKVSYVDDELAVR
jgi:hypothetical protein